MKLSTKARYGARVMVGLAIAYPGQSLSVKRMARVEHLSAKYLEQIMAALKTAGLVTASRGVHGGYALATPPSLIRLSDIFRAIEGDSQIIECVTDDASCPLREGCPTRSVWTEMNEAISGILENTTLQDLVERKAQVGRVAELMYHI